MSEFKKIQNTLWEKYRDSSQESIAELAGISQPTVGRYLCRSKPEYIKTMRLGTFFKLFPDAEIVFEKTESEQYREQISALLEKLSEREQRRAYDVLKLMFEE